MEYRFNICIWNNKIFIWTIEITLNCHPVGYIIGPEEKKPLMWSMYDHKRKNTQEESRKMGEFYYRHGWFGPWLTRWYKLQTFLLSSAQVFVRPKVNNVKLILTDHNLSLQGGTNLFFRAKMNHRDHPKEFILLETLSIVVLPWALTWAQCVLFLETAWKEYRLDIILHIWVPYSSSILKMLTLNSLMVCHLDFKNQLASWKYFLKDKLLWQRKFYWLV